MTIESKITPEMWQYYQDLLKSNGFNGITDLLTKYHEQERENARLQSVIDAANAQEPVLYRRSVHSGWPEYSQMDSFSDGGGGGQALYARPIPAQQSVDRQTIIDILVASGNLSEGVTADIILSAIGLQQSPAVAVHDENAWIIEKLSYHKFEREDLSIDDCLKYLESEWKEVSGRTVRQLVMQILSLLAGQSSPRITEQESFEIILSFYWFMENFKNKNGCNPSVIDWYEAEGHALIQKLNEAKNGS